MVRINLGGNEAWRDGVRRTIIGLDDDISVVTPIPFDECPPIMVEDCDDIPEHYPVEAIREYVREGLDAQYELAEPTSLIVHTHDFWD